MINDFQASKGVDTYGYMQPMDQLAKRNNQKEKQLIVRKAKKCPSKFVGA